MTANIVMTMRNRIQANVAAALIASLAALAGCKKEAPCRPGTLLVSVSCGGATAPGGVDHVILTLKEGTYTPAPESFPLRCPQTNREVAISNYSTTRTLAGSVAIASADGPGQNVVVDHPLPLTNGCTVWNVALNEGKDASPDLPTAEVGEMSGDGGDVPIDGPISDSGGDEIVATPVPDGGLFANGALCIADGECASSKCSGGVCCEERCDGKCQACAAGTGKCSNLPEGTKSSRCSAKPDSSTCGETGACDDKGGCALFGTTTMCQPAACDASGLAVIQAAFCDGLGHCVAGQAGNCGAYRCSGGACAQACTGSGDCNGVPCVDQTCGGKRGVGASCDNSSQCDKGYCVDGVCCDDACTGTCMACAMTATGRPNGTCAPTIAGADPREQCATQTGCGQDGACDGHGACRKHGSETQCQPASCDGNHTFTKAAVCDSAGACGTAAVSECGLYRCSATGCGQGPCSDDNDCATGVAHCDGATHACVAKKGLGSVCTQDDDCNGGPCVKGICCESTCTAGCYSCSGADTGGAMGRCLPVVAGKSDGTCAAKPESTCRETGACNGKGACQMQPVTVECQAESCTGTTYTPPSKCDGAGMCVTPGTKDCGAFLCDGDVHCKTSCASDDDCAPQSFCTAGKCLRAACTFDDWCWHNPRPFGGYPGGVWGAAPNDVWAISYYGAVAHYDGVSWEGVKSPVRGRINAIRGTQGIVWVVADGGAIYKWDGFSWRRFTSGTTNDLFKVWANSPTDAWAVGSQVALHWDGQSWLPTDFSGLGYALTSRSLNDTWAAGSTFVYHWDGKSWNTKDLTTLIGGQSSIKDIVVEPSGDVWAVAHNGDNDRDNYLLHYTNGNWTAQYSLEEHSTIARAPDGRIWLGSEEGKTASWNPTKGDTEPTPVGGLAGISTWGVLPFADNDVFFPVSAHDHQGAVWHWDGQKVTNTFVGPDEYLSAILATNYQTFVTGSSGRIWSTNQQGWIQHQTTIPHTITAIGMSTDALSPLPIVGGTGPSVFKQAGLMWLPVSEAASSTDAISAIASSSNRRTWMVGNGGRIWSYDGPTSSLDTTTVSGTTANLLDVAVIGGTDVWVVGESGTILHKIGSANFVSAPAASTQTITSVCASSTSDIWITTSDMQVFHGTGNTWTAANSGLTSSIWKLLCLGAETWAIDGAGLQAWRFTNGQWTPTYTSIPTTGIAATSSALWVSGWGGAVLQHRR